MQQRQFASQRRCECRPNRWEREIELVLSLKRGCLLGLLCFTIFAFLGAGDEDARFSTVGHKMMCVCGCNQVLLECNHVGCRYSDRMRGELSSALSRADSDDLVLNHLFRNMARQF